MRFAFVGSTLFTRRFSQITTLTFKIGSTRRHRHCNGRHARRRLARRTRRKTSLQTHIHRAINGNPHDAALLVYPAVGAHLFLLGRAVILEFAMRMHL